MVESRSDSVDGSAVGDPECEELVKFEVFVVTRVFVETDDVKKVSSLAFDAVEVDPVSDNDPRAHQIDSKIIHMRRLDDELTADDLI